MLVNIGLFCGFMLIDSDSKRFMMDKSDQT